MPIIIAVEYASAKGSLQGCLLVLDEAGENTCYDPSYLEPPYHDNPNVSTDLGEQLLAYQALLPAVNQREWIDGFISLGFYPPAELRDKSASIYGKPAQTELDSWFKQFAPEPQGEE
jgi:hypothetical protein